jgi:hypothetical protein
MGSERWVGVRKGRFEKTHVFWIPEHVKVRFQKTGIYIYLIVYFLRNVLMMRVGKDKYLCHT